MAKPNYAFEKRQKELAKKKKKEEKRLRKTADNDGDALRNDAPYVDAPHDGADASTSD
jgi:hypothetical protein